MSAPPTIGYTPFPKQAIVHACPADWILFGGAAGPGKTRTMLEEVIQECLRVPGSNTVFFRKEMDQLEQTMVRARTVLEHVAEFNAQKHKWTFHPRPNPWADGARMQSTLLFDSMPNRGSEYDHQGPEYDVEVFDESTHFPVEQIGFLQTRSRSTVPGSGENRLNRNRILYATNPGNISHLYFLNEFVAPRYPDVELFAHWDEPAKQWRRFPDGATGRHLDETELPWHNPAKGKEQNHDLAWWVRTDVHDERRYQYVAWRPQPTPEQLAADEERAAEGLPPEPRAYRCFIQAFLADNPIYHQDGRYAATLRANPDKNLMLAQLYGRWDVFEGQFFSTFDPLIHVSDPIDPPRHWDVWRSLDYASGTSGYLSCHWHTQDPHTRQIITFDEYYVRGDTVDDQTACREINRKSGERYIGLTLADRSMWQGASRKAAVAVAELWGDYGVPLDAANSDREGGWQRMKTLLAINPDSGQPGLRITRNCTNLIQQISLATYKDSNAFDIEDGRAMHALDSERYGLMAGRTRLHAIRGPIKSISWTQRR